MHIMQPVQYCILLLSLTALSVGVGISSHPPIPNHGLQQTENGFFLELCRLYDISMFGINKKHLDAIVSGIVLSIQRAHDDLGRNKPAPIFLAQGMLANASRNRSPSSYLANPQAERDQYEQVRCCIGCCCCKSISFLSLHWPYPVPCLHVFPLHAPRRTVSGAVTRTTT